MVQYSKPASTTKHNLNKTWDDCGMPVLLMWAGIEGITKALNRMMLGWWILTFPTEQKRFFFFWTIQPHHPTSLDDGAAHWDDHPKKRNHPTPNYEPYGSLI
jgi:hypothetical protein